jgi:hypothetical protein
MATFSAGPDTIYYKNITILFKYLKEQFKLLQTSSVNMKTPQRTHMISLILMRAKPHLWSISL